MSTTPKTRHASSGKHRGMATFLAVTISMSLVFLVLVWLIFAASTRPLPFLLP